jgi:hypothetical protein
MTWEFGKPAGHLAAGDCSRASAQPDAEKNARLSPGGKISE